MLRRIFNRLRSDTLWHRHQRVGTELEALEQRRERLIERLDEVQNTLAAPQSERQLARIDADVDSLRAEAAQLQTDQEAVLARAKDTSTAMRRRTRRIAQAGFVITLAVLALYLVLPGSDKSARGVRLDYYSAVAAVAPVLLIAAFVEIGFVLRGSVVGVWTVLTVTVPAIAAGAAALITLATHDSDSAGFGLTVWGLVSTTLLLINLVVAHTTMEP